MAPAIHVRSLDGLALVSPIDPAFDDLATQLLGRIATLGLQLKPFLVILRNETSQTVVSYSITWRVTHTSGKVSTFRLDEYFDQFLPQFVDQKDRTLALWICRSSW